MLQGTSAFITFVFFYRDRIFNCILCKREKVNRSLDSMLDVRVMFHIAVAIYLCTFFAIMARFSTECSI